MPDRHFEVLVVGAGPAGLSSALYLARYGRRTALFDTGHGRSTWHQTNHNYLGFPGGVPARHIRELGRKQLEEYPEVTFLEHKVDAMSCDGGGFIAHGQAGDWHGQAVIICTGVIDHYPHFEGWKDYVGRSMFWCITCDGYETKGKRVLVLGNDNNAASEALQIQRFTESVAVLTDSHVHHVSDSFQERLKRHNILLVHDKIDRVIGHDGKFEAVHTQEGHVIPLDMLFSQQGATPQSKLAVELGVVVNELGYIDVDTEQKTNVLGVYAAGDVTRLHSHQVTTAVHEGGQAASAANYYLYPPDLKDD